MIRAGPYASKEFVHRFRTEASAAAVLQHPNIVAVHEVGMQQGQHFFSMDYVAGKDLAQLLRDGPVPAQCAARYVQKMAEAIQHAHESGILHRDLKPSNVIIDAHDEPRITDFGLAKQLHGDSTVTLTGEVIGTPAYMPPEQASGNRGAVKAWSDIYSLGAILYHLLTGRAPFAAPSLEETIQQVLQRDPVSVRLLNPAVPRDLETICLKCLEKGPVKRYATAQLLADELGRYLKTEPILARPISRAGRVWRWCRRNPRVATATDVAFLSLVIGLAGTTWGWRRAKVNELLALKSAYAADINLAQRALQANDVGLAVSLLTQHRPGGKAGSREQKAEIDLRGWEWRYLWQLCQPDESTQLDPNSGSIGAMALSQDGRRMAVHTGADTIALWDLTVSNRHPGHASMAISAGPGPAGGLEPESLTLRALDPKAVRRFGFTFAGDSRSVITTDPDGVLGVWDCRSAQKTESLSELGSNYWGVALSPDGHGLAAGQASGQVHVWDWSQRRRVATIQFPFEWFGQLQFSRSRRFLRALAGFNDWTTRFGIWRTVDWREATPPGVHGLWTADLSPDDRFLAAGYRDGKVMLWDFPSGQLQTTFTNHDAPVWVVVFSPDERLLASTSWDGTVRLWDLSARREMATLRGHSGGVWAAAFSPDGQRLATGGAGAQVAVKLWDMATRRELLSLEGEGELFAHAAFSPDGSILMAACFSGSAHLWRAPSWAEIEAAEKRQLAP